MNTRGMNRPLLFFTGGTALRDIAAELATRHEPSVHIVTTFDSGGSSAELRRAFGMPAVGDIRNRLLALSPENPLLACRLSSSRPQAAAEYAELLAGKHPLWATRTAAQRRRLLTLLRDLAMPADFDLREASVGNLVLTALYRTAGNSLTRAAHAFARLTGAQGLVRPVTEASAQLAVTLADGREVRRQHSFASKCAPLGLGSPIVDLRLCDEHGKAATADLTPAAARLIRNAGLICYPVGSFFSSVCASLLPSGVAAAVAAARCPKVYLPNPGFDPELEGVPFTDQLAMLRRLVPSNGLHHVLTDPRTVPENCPPDLLVTAPLLNEQGLLDPTKTINALLRLRDTSCN